MQKSPRAVRGSFQSFFYIDGTIPGNFSKTISPMVTRSAGKMVLMMGIQLLATRIAAENTVCINGVVSRNKHPIQKLCPPPRRKRLCNFFLLCFRPASNKLIWQDLTAISTSYYRHITQFAFSSHSVNRANARSNANVSSRARTIVSAILTKGFVFTCNHQ